MDWPKRPKNEAGPQNRARVELFRIERLGQQSTTVGWGFEHRSGRAESLESSADCSDLAWVELGFPDLPADPAAELDSACLGMSSKECSLRAWPQAAMESGFADSGPPPMELSAQSTALRCRWEALRFPWADAVIVTEVLLGILCAADRSPF